MTRFNFLSDSPPAFLEMLRFKHIPEGLRTALAATVTIAMVISVWWGVEVLQIRQAGEELRIEKARALASRADLAQMRVRRSEIERLLVLDRRIRQIRTSGAELSSRLADIANRVPNSAWLTSVQDGEEGLEIDGDVKGLDGLSETVADLASSASAASVDLVRAGRDERDGGRELLSFQMRSEERAR